MRAAVLVLAWSVAAAGARGEAAPRTLPGLQADGDTLLHNQWSIHPVGDQVALGDFPTNMAVDPSGRLVAVLHAGHGKHEVRLVDITSRKVVGSAPLNETFCGVAFSSDGKTLVCSGASDGVLHVFSMAEGQPVAKGDVRVADKDDNCVVAGFALSRDASSAVVALAYDNRVVRVDLGTGARQWTAVVGHGLAAPLAKPEGTAGYVDPLAGRELYNAACPLNIAWDEAHSRIYASLWGESCVAVVDADDGRLIGRWPTGLHPNELVLSKDGRLFVSNGGLNTVTVLDTGDGHATEILSSAFTPGDLPGSTPDSLALSPDGKTLYVANAYTNTVAVFDVGTRGSGRPARVHPDRLVSDGRAPDPRRQEPAYPLRPGARAAGGPWKGERPGLAQNLHPL
jgi:DNA-binding beta-propeller fold protein YncE